MLIFSTQSSEYLAHSFASAFKAPLGNIDRKSFPNGEKYLRIRDAEAMVGQDAVVIASITDDNNLLEVYRIGCTLADLGTRRRIFVIPYLAYSTMEIAKIAGEAVTAKIHARLLSSIPKASGNTFIFLDLHEPSLKHYFEGDVTIFEISAIDILAQAIKRENIENPILGSADLGMPLQTQRLAQLLAADVALVSKSREFSHTAVLAAVGNVNGRNVIIYDDMVRSGTSLIQAARAYKKAGAEKIYAAISHFAIPNDGVVKKLRNSPISKIITTDSHPATQRSTIKRTIFVSTMNTAGVVAKQVKNLIV